MTSSTESGGADYHAAPRSAASGWASLLLFYAIGLIRCVDWFIVGSLLTPIKNDLQLPDEQLGQIGAVFFVASSFTSPIFGYLGDRFPRKPMMLGALAVWNIAAIACGLTSSLTILLIWRAFVGLGQGCYETLLPGWLGDTFAPRWRSLIFAFVQSTAPVGAAIGFILGGYLSARFSWHHAFVFTGAPGILLAIAFIFIKEPLRGQAEQGKTTYNIPTLRETALALVSPLFILYLLGTTAFTTALGCISTWGPSFLHRAYGLSNPDASSFFAFSWVSAGCVGVLLGGWIASIWRRKNYLAYPSIFAIGSALTAPVLFAAFLLENQTLSQILILIEIFFTSLCFGPINALLLETIPVMHRSAASAVNVICAFGLANIISADLTGAISDRHGLRVAMLIAPSALVLSALFLVIYMLLRRRWASFQTRVVPQTGDAYDVLTPENNI
jgi:MFS family permease